jgi:hypothetical protein
MAGRSNHKNSPGTPMNAIVYDKTDKGREEIATRKYHVPPKLRTLLVMIDGRHPLDALLNKFAALGLTQASVDALVHDAYIAPVPGQAVAAAAVPAAPPVAARPPAQAARERLAARARAAQAGAAGVADADDLFSNSALDAIDLDAPITFAHAALANTQLGDGSDGALPAGDAHAELAAPHTQFDLPASLSHAEAPEVVLASAPMAAARTDAERFHALHSFFNQTIKSTIGLRGILLQLKVEKAANVDELRALRTPYLEAVLKAKGEEMARSLRDRLDSLLGGRPANDDFGLPGD